MSFSETIKNLVPTTSTMWTAAGASVLTIALGFTLGGWKTGNAASSMAAEAATAAHTDLGSRVCAAKFAVMPEALELREEMLALSSFQRRSFVQEKPWAMMPGETTVNRLVAERCAAHISEMEPESLAVLEDIPEGALKPEVDPG